MKVKNRPKNGVIGNMNWMIAQAWRFRKRVLLFCIMTAALEVFFQLLQLYIAPQVLSYVEVKRPIIDLFIVIGFLRVVCSLCMEAKNISFKIRSFQGWIYAWE